MNQEKIGTGLALPLGKSGHLGPVLEMEKDEQEAQIFCIWHWSNALAHCCIQRAPSSLPTNF